MERDSGLYWYTQFSDYTEGYIYSLDVNTIRAFSATDSFDVLTNVCDEKLVTTDVVCNEFKVPKKPSTSLWTVGEMSKVDFPYGKVNVINASQFLTFDNKNIVVSTPVQGSADLSLYYLSHGGQYICVTNDDKLRKGLERATLPIIGSAAVLAISVDKGILTLKQAANKHKEMKALGFWVLSDDFYSYFVDRHNQTYRRLIKTVTQGRSANVICNHS